MNILLVEDEARVADFIRRGLAAEGWAVDHAADGEDALEHAAANTYDVILLDHAAPDFSHALGTARPDIRTTPLLACVLGLSVQRR